MNRQLKLILCMVLLSLSLLNLSCQPEQIDEAALIAVNKYIQDLTAAILDSHPDLLGWVREPYSDNLPLRYDEDRIEWLREHKEKFETIRQDYLNDEFPTTAEVARWKVVVVRSDQEWLLEGPELVEAMTILEELYVDVSAAIVMIIENSGELNLNQSDQVLNLVDRIEPEIEAVRKVLFH